MPKCDKLLELARRSPASLRFADLCALAECHGFVFARQRGSHRQYKPSGYPKTINFQPEKHGKAKEYQVKQLLDAIDSIERENA